MLIVMRLRLLTSVKMIGVNRMDIMLKIKLSSQSKFFAIVSYYR